MILKCRRSGERFWTATAERSGDGAFEWYSLFDCSTHAPKAVSRSACHRSPKSSFYISCLPTRFRGHMRRNIVSAFAELTLSRRVPICVSTTSGAKHDWLCCIGDYSKSQRISAGSWKLGLFFRIITTSSATLRQIRIRQKTCPECLACCTKRPQSGPTNSTTAQTAKSGIITGKRGSLTRNHI